MGTAIVQADHDATLLVLWLHGRSSETQRAYRADATTFLTFVGHELRACTLGDLQAFADQLADAGQAPGSRARRLAAVKSLCGFALPAGLPAVRRGPPRAAASPSQHPSPSGS